MRRSSRFAMLGIMLLVLGVPFTSPADPLPHAMCQGTAPAQTTCTTGTHEFTTETLSHGNDGTTPAFVGRVRSTISWVVGSRTGSRTYYCDLRDPTDYADMTANQTGTCVGSGSFPPDCLETTPDCAVRYTHTCKTSNYGTDTGTGRGPWICHTQHI